MRPFKFIFEIRYRKNPPEIFKYREKIIASVSVSTETPNFDLNEGFQFFVKQKKTKIIIENQRLGFDIFLFDEMANPLQFVKDNSIKIIKLLNSELKISRIERIGIRTMWIKETNLTFKELVELYKQIFFKNNELLDQASDISIPLTLEKNESRVNFNTAPMEPIQINSILQNESKQIPDTQPFEVDQPVIYFDFDYYKFEKNGLNFSDSFVTAYISQALKETNEYMLKVSSLLSE